MVINRPTCTREKCQKKKLSIGFSDGMYFCSDCGTQYFKCKYCGEEMEWLWEHEETSRYYCHSCRAMFKVSRATYCDKCIETIPDNVDFDKKEFHYGESCKRCSKNCSDIGGVGAVAVFQNCYHCDSLKCKGDLCRT